MELERDWFLPGGIVCTDYPTHRRGCGWSFKWVCVYCGVQFARMAAYVEGQRQPYKFLGKCCHECTSHAHRYTVPGSLECIELLGWEVPKPVIDWQFRAELAFTEHPEHPHHKVYYS